MSLAPLHERSIAGESPDVLSAEGFAQEFQAHRRVLLTLAAAILGRRGEAEAEDVLQDACAVALGKLSSFEPGTNFAAWMGQIVRYVALNALRRRSGREWSITEGMDQHGTEPPASEEPADPRALLELSRNQDHFDDQVVAALADLTPTARACLLLRAVQDLDYSEVSQLLGIPEGTAMSHVHRARNALRVALLTRQARKDRK